MAKRTYNPKAMVAPLSDAQRAEREADELEAAVATLPQGPSVYDAPNWALEHVKEARALALRVEPDVREAALASLKKNHDRLTGLGIWWGNKEPPTFFDIDEKIRNATRSDESSLRSKREQLIRFAAMNLSESCRAVGQDGHDYHVFSPALFTPPEYDPELLKRILQNDQYLYVSHYDAVHGIPAGWPNPNPPRRLQAGTPKAELIALIPTAHRAQVEAQLISFHDTHVETWNQNAENSGKPLNSTFFEVDAAITSHPDNDRLKLLRSEMLGWTAERFGDHIFLLGIQIPSTPKLDARGVVIQASDLFAMPIISAEERFLRVTQKRKPKPAAQAPAQVATAAHEAPAEDPMTEFIDPLSLIKKQPDTSEINIEDFFIEADD